jgi:predicted Zn-dependent protease
MEEIFGEKETLNINEEGNGFSLSKFILKKMQEQSVSIRALAKKAKISPTVVQKMRGEYAENINYKTLLSVLNILGYRIIIEKIPEPDTAGKNQQDIPENKINQ